MTVGARANNDLIDLNVADLVKGLGVFGKVGEGDGGVYSGEVYLVDLVVFSVRVSLVGNDLAVASLLYVSNSLLVYLEYSVLCACLNCHIAYGKTVKDRQRSNALSNEFH